MKLRWKLLAVPPLLVGAATLAFWVSSRKGPERIEAAERARPVRVLEIRRKDVVPTAIAYGTVRPSRTWAAVAEIAGRVVEISPLLKEGEIVPAGRELIRIDDTDKKLEVARLNAEADGYRAQIAKLDLGKTNLDTLLEVERRSLELAERELTRLENLLRKGSTAEAAVDTQRRAVLAQRGAVVNLENSLRLVPSERAQLEAQLEATDARRKMAERDVARAVIVAPFPCRIDSVDVEETQSVTVGQRLAEAFDIAVAEVEARVAIQQVRHLFDPARRKDVVRSFTEGVDWSRMGIQATVRLRLPGQTYEWEGRFARAAASLAAGTRAAGIVIAVDNPFESAREKGSPPLMKGMFVETELRGPAHEACVIVPRAALRDGRAYLAGPDDRLVIRRVTTDFVQGEEIVVSSGLEEGDRLVVTDLIPAIEGMLLDPQ